MRSPCRTRSLPAPIRVPPDQSGAAAAARDRARSGSTTASARVERVIEEAGEKLDVIIGTPDNGEMLDGTSYDGKTEIALFPGDLPPDPQSLFEDGQPIGLKFLRFLPPKKLERDAGGNAVLPHIRLDRALDYLIGDWLR